MRGIFITARHPKINFVFKSILLMVCSKILAFAVLCFFALLVDDQQYMWGPNESQRLATEQNRTCHQSISFAGHGLLSGLQLPLRLADGLPDVLHHEEGGCLLQAGVELLSSLLVRLRRVSLTALQQTHTHPASAQLSRGKQGCISQLHFLTQFVKCISQLYFCLTTQRHKHTSTHLAHLPQP